MLVATTKVAGANLPTDVAAAFQMVRRQAAFTGVVIEAAHFGAAIER